MKFRAPLLLATILAAAGLIHFASPRTFDQLIPAWLPGSNDFWIYGSGALELACAASLVHPRSRRFGALATAILFVAVFPGNIQMAVSATGTTERAITYARLPLQVPLVWWALRIFKD